MKTLIHKNLLLLLLLVATGGSLCQAQTVSMRLNDTVYVDNCRNANGFLNFYYNGTDAIDAWAVIDCHGIPLTLNPSYSWSTNPNRDLRMRVWDSDTAAVNLLVDTVLFYIPFSLTLNVPSGHAVIQICSNSGPHVISLDIPWTVPGAAMPLCTSAADDFQVVKTTPHSACIVWNSGGQPSQVTLGNTTTNFYGDSLWLLNLQPNSQYTVDVCALADLDLSCCHSILTFYTDPLPAIGCPDLADIHGTHVRCYYGGVGAPYHNIGIIDTSASTFFNRHMVFTDTNQRDGIADYHLRTVYPGATATVKLGNHATGAQAEAISYSLHIDTNYYAILLLHYAVVLQNPDHTPSQQPRFRLEILDSIGTVIDPTCGTADFQASSSLGWNEAYDALWKDWTTVGFDLTPYHGQNIQVRFTTYDCAEGQHFGYAYFCADCRLKSAVAEYCASADSNTMTAPDGFHYLWYFNDPSDTVSTEQTVHFSNTDDLLHCRLISTENPECWVTLNTYAGYRWPDAIIDTLQTEDLGCDGYRVYFTNRSRVVNENGTPTGEPCETATWYFGDGYLSQTYSPIHTYRTPGDHTVRLVAGIAGGQCKDTTEFVIHIPDFLVPVAKDTFACRQFVIDGVTYRTDTIGPSRRVHNDEGCDTLYTLHLHILHDTVTTLPADTFCYRDTYTWLGQTVGAGNDTITQPAHHLLTHTYAAANLCDSTVRLPLVQMPPPPLPIRIEPDCPLDAYHLTAVTDRPYLRWSADPPDPAVDSQATLNPITVSPQAPVTYHLMADYTDSFACPNFNSVHLDHVAFPDARLTVRPEALTVDNALLTARDDSRTALNRRWLLVPHPDADTLRPAEAGPTLTWLAPSLGLDSITVILAIGEYTCTDTARQTVPFVRTLLWAPNTFTPSGEGNRRFTVVASGIRQPRLSIYSRTGHLLFRTTDLERGWDGTSGGTPCPQGAYVWLLEYQSDEHPGIDQRTKGTVTLLR